MDFILNSDECNKTIEKFVSSDNLLVYDVKVTER